MKNQILHFTFLAGLLALAGHTSAAEEDIITQSFPLKPGGELIMKVDRGSIEINTHSADLVEVKVTRELSRVSSSRAREIFAEHTIEMTEQSGGLRIQSESPSKSSGFSLFRDNPFNRLRVHYRITVPARFDLDLRTAGGEIRIADIEGNVQSRTAGGSLRFGHIRGPVNAHTSGGSIRLASATGDIKVHTSGGNIRVDEARGSLSANTSGGSIEIGKASGSVEAETSGGNIRIGESSGPMLYARTSGGSVSASMAQPPTADCTLKTSGGNVELSLPAQAAVTVSARANGGGVQSEFPGELNKQKNRFHAALNGGGPSIQLQTSGGSIRIRKN